MGRDRSRLQVLKRDATQDNSSKMIRGYGAVFYNASEPGTEYWLWDDIVERVMPGAFDIFLASTPDIRGLFNHDSNMVLGRTISGTCRVAVDPVGLYYEIDESPNDPTWASTAEKINRGDVSGSSYSFWPRSVVWEETKIGDKDVWVRWIKDVEIVYDVGPVTFPAFAAATSSRSVTSNERDQLLAERLASLPAVDESIAIRMRMLQLDQLN